MKVNKIRKIKPTYKEACELYGFKSKDNVDFETRISNECFNLDEYFAHEILIHILWLKEKTVGAPGVLCKVDEYCNIMADDDSREKWEKILGDIALGFYLRSRFDFDFQADEKTKAIMEKKKAKAFQLFTKWFDAFWE